MGKLRGKVVTIKLFISQGLGSNTVHPINPNKKQWNLMMFQNKYEAYIQLSIPSKKTILNEFNNPEN